MNDYLGEKYTDLWYYQVYNKKPEVNFRSYCFSKEYNIYLEL